MEPLPVSKNNEQFPLLLNVENGLDTATRKPPTTVNREVKRVLANHWPRILSAYWIAVAIFMALALIGYSIAVGWQKDTMFGTDYYYEEPLPNDRVFLYHFVPMGLLPTFATYSDFLSDLTSKHPYLQINLAFLIDDYRSPHDMQHGRAYLQKYKLRNVRDWHRFQLTNENFKYSTYRLSLFMRRTPLKHYWKTIPLSYLPFYIRVYTVFKVGGIGMDLDALNYQYNIGLDRRIRAILKNHNDGRPEKDYNRLLRDIDEEEQSCSLSFARILNETMAVFNQMFPFTEDIRSGFLPFLNLFPAQSKYILDDANSNDTTQNAPSNKTETRNLAGNTSLEVTDEANQTTKLYDLVEQYEKMETRDVPLKMNETSANASSAVNRSDILDFDGPQVFIFYLSLSDKGQPNSPVKAPSEPNTYKNEISHLALSSDGSFVAATHKNHEFLSMLLSAGLHRMRPEVAIWNTLQTDCANVDQSIIYCNVYRL